MKIHVKMLVSSLTSGRIYKTGYSERPDSVAYHFKVLKRLHCSDHCSELIPNNENC